MVPKSGSALKELFLSFVNTNDYIIYINKNNGRDGQVTTSINLYIKKYKYIIALPSEYLFV